MNILRFCIFLLLAILVAFTFLYLNTKNKKYIKYLKITTNITLILILIFIVRML
ncbi:MAG: hypothetical protein RL626_441 [Pseudomonadota bacterium]|jgi:hypothetical protein